MSEIPGDYRNIGFIGCTGASHCCHLCWKNCLDNQKGQGHMKNNGTLGTLVAQAWYDRHLYIWSWFFGLPSTNNELHILHASSLLHDIFNDSFWFKATPSYKICDNFIPNRNIPYFLVDGIYSGWRIFVGPISEPMAEQAQHKLAQESVRKDIELSFVVLTWRFQILKNGLCFWKLEDAVAISECCVILHTCYVFSSIPNPKSPFHENTTMLCWPPNLKTPVYESTICFYFDESQIGNIWYV